MSDKTGIQNPLADLREANSLGRGTRAPMMAGRSSSVFDGSNEDWLTIARQAFDSYTMSLETIRKDWERPIAHFQNRHRAGSKYYSADYSRRSKLFRPRTRAMIRKSEAMAAGAFFSNLDQVAIEPENPEDKLQVASATVVKNVLDYRLKKSIKWFQTLLGAYQDASVIGCCVSKQTWRYETRTVGYNAVAAINPETNEPIVDETGAIVVEKMEPIIEVVTDRPDVQLFPPENVRIDPAASWIDPINTSPAVILMTPMYVQDVKARMKAPPGESLDAIAAEPENMVESKWHYVDDAALRSAQTGAMDRTRATREWSRTDSKEQTTVPRDFDIVWVHENFVKKDGIDYVYFTLGTTALLSDPKPVKEVYWHADKVRPVVMGVTVLEAHKVYPPSRANLSADLQAELNDITNQRMDNVRLATNGRYFVKQGKVVDLTVLRRSTPGGVVMVTDVDKDVKWDRPGDVTGNAYQEQDRLNVEFDEVAGAFSPASVQSNRTLNETVGGMNLLQGNANGMAEYDLRMFTETWVEPVLGQLLKLVQRYETDETILAIAGRKARLMQRFGMDSVTDELLSQELTATVNVGMAATQPERQIMKFAAAAKQTGEIFGPTILGRLDQDAILDEIWGLAGYRGAQRFFKPDPAKDPNAPQQPPSPAEQAQQMQMQMQQQMAQLEMQGRAQAQQIEAQRAALEAQQAQVNMALAQQKEQREAAAAQQRAAIDQAALASKQAKDAADMKLAAEKARLEDQARRRQADQAAQLERYKAQLKDQTDRFAANLAASVEIELARAKAQVDMNKAKTEDDRKRAADAMAAANERAKQQTEKIQTDKIGGQLTEAITALRETVAAGTGKKRKIRLTKDKDGSTVASEEE